MKSLKHLIPSTWFYYQDSKGFGYTNTDFTFGKNFNMISFINWLKFTYPDILKTDEFSQSNVDFKAVYYSYDSSITSVCFQSMIDEFLSAYESCLVSILIKHTQHHASNII